MIPYTPIFNKTPARTIDPDSGASTWAFGSHRCIINIGSFTKNIMNTAADQKDIHCLNDRCVIMKFSSFLKITIININKGIDVLVVYKII